MKTIEIIGYNRANLGKNESRKLRNDGNVPCVVYGGKKQIHFHSPMILFRELVYSPGANFIELNIEGEKIKAILQDIQFHPVSDIILHADFLELNEDKSIKMEIPVSFTGYAPGLRQGVKILTRLRKLTVKSLPKHMPEFIEIDISELELGKSIKVGDLEEKDYEISIFFDKQNYNLVGWQNVDMYQNFNITFISGIRKNRLISKNLFKIPTRN